MVLLESWGLWRRKNEEFLHLPNLINYSLLLPSRQNQVLLLEFSTHPQELGNLAVHCLGSRDAVDKKLQVRGQGMVFRFLT